jgi:hypothetical protein
MKQFSPAKPQRVYILIIILILFTFSLYGQVVYYLEEIYEPLQNPYKGWVPLASGGPYQQPHSLVFVPITWRKLEPVKYCFDWETLETVYKFDFWKSRGVKIIFRFILDYPGVPGHLDIPDWLYEETGFSGTWYDTPEIGGGFSPDYDNNVLKAEHSRVMAALGARYNNDPGIAFIQIGSLGHWGEWHTWPYDPWTGSFPDVPVSEEYVCHYLNNFPDKITGMRRPFQIARDNLLGLYNDSFGNTLQTDTFISWYNNGYTDDYGHSHPPMLDFWKNAFSGGEFYGGNSFIWFDATHFEETLRQAHESHISWLGPCCPAVSEPGCPEQENMNILLKEMGYRYVIETVSHDEHVVPGSELPITLQWNNKGSAPFYYNWQLELSLADINGLIVTSNLCTDVDIRTLLPGMNVFTTFITIPSSIGNGTYTLLAAIIDPEKNEPGIDFAITGRRDDGRYALSQVHVGESNPGHPVIIIDGKADDWEAIPSLCSGSGAIDTLSGYQDETGIYFLVKGTKLREVTAFYLDTDNDLATGYHCWVWPPCGIDFLIENSFVYHYTGDGTSWSWEFAGSVDIVKRNKIIELRVDHPVLGMSGTATIGAGFIYNYTDYSPSAGTPLPVLRPQK